MQGKIAIKLSDNVTLLTKRCGYMKNINAYQVAMQNPMELLSDQRKSQNQCQISERTNKLSLLL